MQIGRQFFGGGQASSHDRRVRGQVVTQREPFSGSVGPQLAGQQGDIVGRKARPVGGHEVDTLARGLQPDEDDRGYGGEGAKGTIARPSQLEPEHAVFRGGVQAIPYDICPLGVRDS